MFKQILYCSTANGQWSEHVPTAITDIIVQGRRFNRANNITGFLCYKGGYYLQAIEGPTEVITSLYKRICTDSRHYDVNTLLDEANLTTREFQAWSLKLASTSPVSEKVALFIDKKWPALKNNNKAALKILSIFYKAQVRSNYYNADFPSLRKVGQIEVKLLSVPTITSAQVGNHDLLDIYGHLIMRWRTFYDLLGTFRLKEYELYNLLHQLYQSDDLAIRKYQVQHANNTFRNQSKPRQSDSNFYSQLRSFFRRYV